MPLYSETSDAGNPHRLAYLRQTHDLVFRRYNSLAPVRASRFQPDCSDADAYAASVGPHREKLARLLGWPLIEHEGVQPEAHTPTWEQQLVGEDELGRVYRVWVEALLGWRMYGVLLEPRGDGPRPLVIAQHGGLGTPELAAEFFRESNYGDFPRRLLRRGALVYLPQVMLWGNDYGACDVKGYPESDRVCGSARLGMDALLRAAGGCMVALEVFGIRTGLDLLLQRPDVDRARVGMMGMSWGGFYTLVTAALDTRIRAAVDCCMLHDGAGLKGLHSQAFRDAALHYQLAEIAAMICPRRLCIEMGREDQVIPIEPARVVARHAEAFWERVGVPERFLYREHAGGHSVSDEDTAIDFLFSGMEAAAADPAAAGG